MPTADALAPEDRPVLAELLRLGHAEDMALLTRLPRAYERDRAWAMLSRGFANMTKAGLAEFFEARPTFGSCNNTATVPRTHHQTPAPSIYGSSPSPPAKTERTHGTPVRLAKAVVQ